MSDGYRGVGLREKLMSEALLRARGIGISLVQLAVFGNNSVTTGLYARMGFRRSGAIPGKTVRDGRQLDEVTMYADLRAIDKSSSQPRRKS